MQSAVLFAIGGVACSRRCYLQTVVLLGSMKKEEACDDGVACSWRCCVPLAVGRRGCRRCSAMLRSAVLLAVGGATCSQWCCFAAYSRRKPATAVLLAVGGVACRWRCGGRAAKLRSAVLLAVGGATCSRRCYLQSAVLLGSMKEEEACDGDKVTPFRKCNCISNIVNILFILLILYVTKHYVSRLYCFNIKPTA